VYVANDINTYYGLESSNEGIALYLSEEYDAVYNEALVNQINDVFDKTDLQVNMYDSEGNEIRVIIDYKDLMNIKFRIAKYNDPDFEVYNSKFFEETTDGERFKAVGTLLFYQIILAVFLAIYFTYQLPIVIERNENNETELKSKIGPRMPKIRLMKRKDRNLKRKTEEGK